MVIDDCGKWARAFRLIQDSLECDLPTGKRDYIRGEQDCRSRAYY
jgi:hypothetical protein